MRILEAGGTVATPARVNVMGSDSAFYQPDAGTNPLAEYNFNRLGNRSNVGPLRYQGSFFYTEGSFAVKLPPGVARVEVSKGYGYNRSVLEANIAPGKTTHLDVMLQPVIDWKRSGWTSVDTHVHISRAQPAADDAITALLSADGVDAGYIMTNSSAKGYGAASTVTRHGVSIASGQEIINPALGHINVLMADQRIGGQFQKDKADDLSSRTDDPLAATFDRIHAAHGAMQHNHGGYEEEILADVVLGKSDWVELLQFGSYRPKIGLAGYYLLLNSGFRYPLVGGSDYPACRTLADSMTYVAGGRGATLGAIVERMTKGESFATSGPLLFLSVNGKGPGSDIEFTGAAPHSVNARVLAVSADLPFTDLEIVQDGKPVARWHDAQPVFRKELSARLTVNSSTWIAARASGPETAHAHTNPVWIYCNGKAPFQANAARELLQHLQAFKPARVRPDAAAVLESAQTRMKEIIQSGPAAPQITRNTSGTTSLPVVRPRPRAASATVEGEIVDAAGRAIPDALVAANGAQPTATADARGHFVLKQVGIDRSLFLRVSKPGRVTTNTSYLNPRTATRLRIPLLTSGDLEGLLSAWSRQSGARLPDAASRAVVLLNSVGADGKPVTGLSVSASPELHATRDQLALPRIVSANPAQMIGVTRIELQAAYPEESDPHEANLIVSVKPMQKDLVIPAFPGQIGYALIVGE